ncbi:MAG: DUF4347 domain-containing protein, partial [Okeania sp. SIO3I5]|uniref:DUF4347 domain-containing protein n=1 Tax=Okeania sp. SIO3I5 TaxID=2607805 RepID=UPI0013B624B2
MSQLNICQPVSTKKSIQFVNFSSQLESPEQIVFIDSNVEDYQSLANGVLPKTKVVILDPTSDGIQDITQVITKYPHISSIHIVSHGAPGCLHLGNSQLNINSINNDYSQELESWSVTNLLLYGCSVAADNIGEEFLLRLREVTGANVAASARPTGNVALGGDWELEVIKGELEVDVPFTQETQQEWNYVLTTPFAERPRLLQVLDSVLNQFNPLTGQYEVVGDAGVRYNAAGYSPGDDFVYGISENGELVRISSDGSLQYVTPTGGLSDNAADAFTTTPAISSIFAGDISFFDVNGQPTTILWTLDETVNGLRPINISAVVSNDGSNITQLADIRLGDISGNIDDFAFIEINGRRSLYGVNRDGLLYEINVNVASDLSVTATATSLSGDVLTPTVTLPAAAGEGGTPYGAVWTDAEGKLFVNANQDTTGANSNGRVFHIRNFTSLTSAAQIEELSLTPLAEFNDGIGDAERTSIFDIPQIDLSGTDTASLNHADTFTEGDTGVDIVDLTAGDNGLVIRDLINNGTTADGGRLASATITLTNPFDGDEFVVADPVGTIGSAVSGAGDVVTLTATSGTASVADFVTALQAIQFRNTSEAPNTTDRSIQFVVVDEDGNSSDAIFANPATERQTTTITVIPVNDAPTFSALDNTPTFVGNPVILDGDATISDFELDARDNYSGATLTLERNGGANAEDVFSSGDPSVLGALREGQPLTVNGTTIGTVTTNTGGTLLLTFNSSATGALVDSALQNIGYSNSTPTVAPVTIDYTINDGNTADDDQGTGGALTGSGSITVTVTDNVVPTAVDDTTVTNQGTPVTFSITNNDNDTDGTLRIDTVDLDPSTPLTQETTQTVPGQGTYTVNNSGDVTFTPDATFVGTATPITYTVEDDDGAYSNEATISVRVNDPPTATNDTSVTNKATPVTFSITGNDSDTDGTLDLTTVDLDPGTDGRQTSNTVPGQGTYTVDNAGNVTFTPEATFVGTTTPITYTVADNDGGVSNEATVSVTVNNVPPTATDDTSVTNKATPVTFSITGNDSDTDGTLDLTTVDLDPSTAGRQTSNTVPGQGTYTVDNAGNVTFTPEATFVGTTTPITYTVADNDGGVSNEANITVTVNNVPPTATDDTSVTNKATPVTFSITGNDSDTDGTLDLTTVDLDPSTAGRQTSNTVPGQGTYTVDNAGNVTFTPEATFVGTTTPITYTVADNDGGVSNEANITVTVNNVPPTATDDTSVTNKATPVTFSITGNDSDTDGTLDLTTVDLDPSTAGRQTSNTVPGQGTYTVDNAGNVTFTPEATFVGT